jgi:hypothetical protein
LENSEIFGENTIPVLRGSRSATKWKSYPNPYENLPALRHCSFAFNPSVQYNKDELTDIMSAQLSEEMGLDMRRDYVRLVLSVFYSVARYPRDWQVACHSSGPKPVLRIRIRDWLLF